MKHYELPLAELLEFESEDIMAMSGEETTYGTVSEAPSNPGDVQNFAFD